MNSNLDVVVCGTFVSDILGRPINIRSGLNLGSLSMIDEIQLFTGGLGCNLSIDLAKLGIKTGVMGRIGNDNWQHLFFSAFKKEGIDFNSISIDDNHNSAATIVCVDESGERTFFHVGGAHMSVNAEDILNKIEYINRSKVFALGYYGCMPALEPDLPYVFKELKNKTNVKILLETAGFVKSSLDDLKESLPYIDFWLPSFEEGKTLTNETTPEKMVDCFKSCGAKNIVGIKLGSDGCYLTNQGESVFIKPFKVDKVIDTTGAGDAFLAGIITGYLKGMGLFDMGRLANMVGACAVQSLGASTGVKSFKETVNLISES